MTDNDPRFFSDLAGQQTPDYLWIGCSDSRVSANTIVDLQPGEVFVHRNVANLVIHTDMNCLSVLQFAVEVLSVKHIIICGHYGCGGVVAALEGKHNGLIDNWLRHIQDTAKFKESELLAIDDMNERVNRLCELNVCEQVINVGKTTIVQEAWDRGRALTVNGWIYGLEDGRIRDLDISMTSVDDLVTLQQLFFSNGRPQAANTV